MSQIPPGAVQSASVVQNLSHVMPPSAPRQM
jgi:hypothetical protein